jgi:hypothetical protein
MTICGNIWTNPGEIAGNGIDDDGNGLVDDVHGADFVGNNVGIRSIDPAQDGNPTIRWAASGSSTSPRRRIASPAIRRSATRRQQR